MRMRFSSEARERAHSAIAGSNSLDGRAGGDRVTYAELCWPSPTGGSGSRGGTFLPYCRFAQKPWGGTGILSLRQVLASAFPLIP